MHDTLVGVDIAKAVFQLALSSRPGRFDAHRRLTGEQFLPFVAQLPPAVFVMEACGTAHHWARKIRERGHAVVLLPPHLVRPYVQRNKTDRADAKALVEAYRHGEIRPVPVKTPQQQLLTSLHRVRGGWVRERTARLNRLRGLLREQGFFIAVGAKHVLPAVGAIIEDADNDLAMPLRALFAELCSEIRELERRIDLVEDQLAAVAKQLPAVQRLLAVPGIGLIIATALVGFAGDLRRFPSARHFASYLGLTPREYSTGLRHLLGRISKRGDPYLRMLLIHGARAVLSRAAEAVRPDRLRAWALALRGRAHHNKAAVALANKTARMPGRCWSATPTTARCPPRPEFRREDAPSRTSPRPPRLLMIDLTAEQVGPTHGQAGSNAGLRGRCQRLAAVRADSVMARSPRGLQRKRPQIGL